MKDYAQVEYRQIIEEKKIHTLYFESHYLYKNKVQEMRDYFGIQIIVKIGIESFNDEFRNQVLNKNVHYESIEELKQNFDSPCLMVGIQGQTKEMIDQDMALLQKYFDYGTISVYRNNSTPIKRDDELIEWFMNKYQYLIDDPRYDFLYDPTDFGVGD